MANDLETSIVVKADATGVESGMQRAKRSLEDFAGTAEKAGRRADEGLAGVGKGGDAAARKVESATRSMEQQIQRQILAMQSGGRESAAYWEAMANHRGVSATALRPLLDQLEAARAKTQEAAKATTSWRDEITKVGPMLGSVLSGISFAAVTAKLISVQREFDVLFASLQTVAGGSAAAEREMEWLKEFAKETPFGLAQATQGFVKMKALGLDPTRESLTSFGNTASAMGKSLDQMIEAVADASTSEFERLKEFGIKAKQDGDTVALTFQGVTTTIGNNATEIVRYLEQIGNVEFAGAMATRAKTLDGAISELGDTWDELFRTINDKNAGALIFDTVKLASGAIEEATKIIIAMSDAAGENARETGAMATILSGIGTVFETVAVLGANLRYVLVGVGTEIGGLAAQVAAAARFDFSGVAAIREQMVADAKAARAEIDAMEKRILSARGNTAQGGSRRALDPVDEAINAAAKGMTEQLRAQARAAEDLAAIKQKLYGVDKDYLPTLNKLFGEYSKGTLTLAEYRDLVGKLAESNYKADKSAAASAKDAVGARLQALKAGYQSEVMLARSAIEDLASQRRMQQISERDYIDQTAQLDVGQLERKRSALQQELALQSSQKDSLKEVAALRGQIDQVDQEITERRKKQLREVTELTHQQKRAILEVIVAQQQQDQADYAAADRERGEALNRALTTANEYGKAIDDNNRAVEFELGLMGQGERSRRIAIEQYRAQLRLNEQIAKIKKETNNAEDQAVAIAKAQEAYQRELSGISQKVMLEEWNRTTEEINRTLTDALMRGFEDGKGFAQNMRDTIVNMFKTMVLRPVISAILSPVSAALGGVVNGVLGGGVAGAVNGVSGGLNALSTANNAYTALSGYSGGVNTLAGLLGGGQAAGSSAAALGYANGVGAVGGDALGALIAGNASWGGVGAGSLASMGSLMGGGSTVTTSLAGFYTGNLGYGVGAATNMGLLGSGTYGVGAIAAEAGAVAGASAGASAATGAVASGAAGGSGAAGTAAGMGPYGWIAAAVILAAMAFAGKGEKRFGGRYAVNYEGDSVYNAGRDTYIDSEKGKVTFLEGPSGGEFGRTEVGNFIDGTVKGINDIFKAVGSEAMVSSFQAGLETSGKGRGGVFSGGTLNNGSTFGESGGGNNYEGTQYEKTSTQSPDAETAIKNLATDMLQVTVQALQAATDLPKTIANQLKGIDAEALTDEAATTLLNSISAQIEFVKGFRDAINQLPFENLRDLSFDAAAGLIAAGGGLETFAQNQSGFFQNYFTAEEQREAAIKRLSLVFEDLDLVMPALSDEAGVSREAFRVLARGIDVTTEAGQKQYAGLIALQGAFAELTPAIGAVDEAARAAAASIANERDNLQRQIWSLLGDTGAIRAADLAKLDESNRPLQEQIWALQDAKAAAEAAAAAQAAAAQAAAQAAASFVQAQEQAAQRVRDAWSSIGDSLIDEIKRIRGEATGTGALGYAQIQGQFAITTAQARAGDQVAAEALPELSRTLLEMSKDNASSSIALKQMQLQIAASLEETLKYAGRRGGFTVPSLAVGTAFVPGDTLAQLHKGEAVIPAAFNPFTAGSMTGGDNAALLAEVRQLRADNRAQAGEIARLNLRVAKVLEKWDGDGMPAVREEAVA